MSNYVGNDLASSSTVLDVWECREFCRTDPDCHFFTFTVASSHCQLKNGAGNTDRQKSSAHRSGSEGCLHATELD